VDEGRERRDYCFHTLSPPHPWPDLPSNQSYAKITENYNLISFLRIFAGTLIDGRGQECYVPNHFE
jgi:hypothetical protein